jgi:hypothetical protein
VPNWMGAAVGSLAAALIAGVAAALRFIFKRQRAAGERQQALEEGVKALLHDRIYKSYAECFQKGYADVDDIRNLEYLYRPYHALNGNGTGTELYERVKKMPGNLPSTPVHSS